MIHNSGSCTSIVGFFFLVPPYIDLCQFSDKIPTQASHWWVIFYFSHWYWSVWLEDKLTLGHGAVMLIAGGKCFGLCNIRWKIYQFFSALFLKSFAWEITLPVCDDSVNYFIYMEITHVKWLWKPSNTLRESCQKAIHVQCKNCNILGKVYLRGALRLKVVGTEGGHYLIAKTSYFLKEYQQPLGWRGVQALWQSSREFSLGQSKNLTVICCHQRPTESLKLNS